MRKPSQKRTSRGMVASAAFISRESMCDLVNGLAVDADGRQRFELRQAKHELEVLDGLARGAFA